MELLIITGSMGAGKSAVLAEASDILKLRNLVHAAIDVDSLFLGHLPSEANNDDVMYDNLRSVCNNYAARGIQRFLFALAIENRAQLELCREITSATDTIICRLTVSVGVMQHRVKTRESGVLQQEFVARVEKLKAILDAAQLEDFTVSNENRLLNEVALEMLNKAGWISN